MESRRAIPRIVIGVLGAILMAIVGGIAGLLPVPLASKASLEAAGYVSFLLLMPIGLLVGALGGLLLGLLLKRPRLLLGYVIFAIVLVALGAVIGVALRSP